MTGPSLVVTMGMRGFVQPALAGITPMRPNEWWEAWMIGPKPGHDDGY
ncbi:MAG: hypothetical protein JOY67_01590 [Hyphomicrobiales bacterium]|nr:hypothetical protein [Hyphomicrobiales bacterium]